MAEAGARWQAVGVDAALLSGIDLQIGDLGGTTLGLAAGHTIWLDDNAAGWGWFVDATPRSDTEYLLSGNQGEQHRVDLLTVVMHEMGHLLGYDHDTGGLMAETLATGARRTAVQDDHAAAVDHLFNQSVDLRPDAWWGTWLTEQLEPQRPWAKRRR